VAGGRQPRRHGDRRSMAEALERRLLELP
jgi:hypothetical protein